VPNASSRAMALRLTQPVTEMNIKNLPGGKARPTVKADKLTAVCEPMSTQCGILNISTACYGDSFTFLYVVDVRTSQETYI
jgi:hypothetical protein